jgi:Ca2+-binding EF-hand superfamily protein
MQRLALFLLASFAVLCVHAQGEHPMTRTEARSHPGLEAAFDIVDADHNGVLDRWELDYAMGLDAPLSGAGARSARKLELFRYFDVNGDGRISRDEAAQLDPLARNFAAFDRNRDGAIDASEFGRVRLAALARPAAAASSASTGSSAPSSRTFRDLDRNRDGYLSQTELRSGGNRFTNWLALDRNRDGLISPSEFERVEASR